MIPFACLSEGILISSFPSNSKWGEVAGESPFWGDHSTAIPKVIILATPSPHLETISQNRGFDPTV